jgi:two-component system CheB/CheR fusion protein
MSADDDAPGLHGLLDFLKRTRGFDFTGYKPASLGRRMRKRMDAVEVDRYVDYLEYLEVHPDEFAALFDTLLINVTSFFRDAPAWRHIDEHVLPPLIEQAGDRDLRIWSAGCASGEEAYSISMLLVRHLGEAAFRDRVKVYATDVDEDALSTARHGRYGSKQVGGIPADLLERCFEGPQRLSFRKDLRRSLIFGRNDLVQDAPISRIDLLLCRNVLMYFNAETQARILRRFNFALAEHGRLVLGKSEMLLTHGDLFRASDLKSRVFAKAPRAPLPEDATAAAAADGGGAHLADGRYGRIRDAAFDLAPVAQLVVDDDGRLALANQRARTLFGLTEADLGRPLKDLEVSYRPIDLRSAIDQAHAERRSVSLGNVRWPSATGDGRRLDVHLAPVRTETGSALGTSVTFDDVSGHLQLRDELEHSKRDLELAYEELQATVEVLETTNEELQSTNEELETTNEELQSTNEELETMNEELQSTNEELETINDELRDRSLELNEVNGFLESILSSVGVAVIVLDRSMTIQIWNRQAEELWGLRSDEAVGEHFLGLEIGLPVDRLRTALRASLNGASAEGPIVLEALNRVGRSLVCAVTCAPLTVEDGEVRGAIMLLEERTAG